MKKLFSTLGVVALATLTIFTSCKDEDTPAATTTVVTPVATINNQESDAKTDALQAAQAADPTVASVEYTYEVDGETYSTAAEAAAALAKKPAGSTATVVVTLVTKKADGTTVKTEKKTTTVTIPTAGTQTVNIQVPGTTKTVNVTLRTTDGTHNGGAGN